MQCLMTLGLVANLLRLRRLKTLSDILDAVHKMAQGLHKVGGMDKTTLRQIEALCVPAAREYSPAQNWEIREKAHTSRSVLAALLSVGASTVEHWERGLT